MLDNVRIAYHHNVHYGVGAAMLRFPSFQSEEKELTGKALDFLAVFGLADRHQGTGPQPALWRAAPRAWRSPGAGLPAQTAASRRAGRRDEPVEVGRIELMSFIRQRFDLTILLIEHQMRVVMGICERITVMDFGVVIAGARRARSRQPESDRGLPWEGGGVMLLEVKDLQVSYGAMPALKGISFNVDEGEIVTLIGANGAGKSTTLKTISGLVQARSGSIVFSGADITEHPRTRSWRWAFPTARRAREPLLDYVGTREPAVGGLHPDRQEGDRPGDGERLRALPSPAGAHGSASGPRSPAASSRCWRWGEP